MIANYHSHTARCGHAEGWEDEYAEHAAASGLKLLGFSDHTPYDYFDSEPRNRPIRMKPEELPGYAGSVRALAEKYRGQMEIRLGVEAEYYPKYFPRLLELLRENGIEYMLLGQHFLGNEIDEPYSGRETDCEATLERYVCQVSEALDTGLFSCVAHPDLLHFTGADDVYARHMRRLCRAAADAGVPLEINLLGIREMRHYPDARFWRIAAEEGCEAVLGCDAHAPADVTDPESERVALAMAGELGIRLLPELTIKKV
ncbi:MAG: histidinol-phosphatase [Oscillospiraceae bacterium]|nr:histidinol-phosphatase [Oscillospiraceae bacterium]